MEKSWTFGLSSNWDVTKSEMSEYGKVKLSGTLDTGVSNSTFIGATHPWIINRAYVSNSTMDRYPLDGMIEFSAGTNSFTNQIVDYDRSDDYPVEDV